MKITGETDLSSLLAANPDLLPALLRFGISLSGKEKKVSDICRSNCFDQDLLLCALNALLCGKIYFGHTSLQTFSLLTLVDFHEKEDAFLREKFLQIMRLAESVNVDFCEKSRDFSALLSADIAWRVAELYPNLSNLYEAYYSPIETSVALASVSFAEENFAELQSAFDAFFAALRRAVLSASANECSVAEMVEKCIGFAHYLEFRKRLALCLTKNIVRQMEKQLHSARRKNNHVVRYRSHLTVPSAVRTVLSPREAETLRWLASGLTMKEIAQKMGVAPTTVLTHRKHLSEKLKLKTIAELTAYAVRNQL